MAITVISLESADIINNIANSFTLAALMGFYVNQMDSILAYKLNYAC